MQLAFTVVGPDQPELIAELTRTVKDCRCSILESRMTELNTEFAAHLLVDGNWNHIAKLENALEAFAARHHLKLALLRAREVELEPENVIPYAVDIFASDQLDNMHEVVAFFTDRHIKVMDLSSSRYPAPYSGSPLFLAHLIIKIPAGVKIVSLRDEFLEFCDQQNLDAILEPIKR